MKRYKTEKEKQRQLMIEKRQEEIKRVGNRDVDMNLVMENERVISEYYRRNKRNDRGSGVRSQKTNK